MSGGERAGQQVRVRRYSWRNAEGDVPGVMVDARREGRRYSLFIPAGQLAGVADGLIDVLEQIESEGEGCATVSVT